MRAIGIGALLLLSALISGCEGRSDPMTTITGQARSIGVYAKFSDSLDEIHRYYVKGRNGGLNRAVARADADAGDIAKGEPPEFFVVNLPNVQIAESQVYWFDDAEALVRAQNAWAFETPRPLSTNIEDLGSTIYKVSASELAQRAAERRRKASATDLGSAVLVLRLSADTQAGAATEPAIYVDLIGPRPPDDRMYRVSVVNRQGWWGDRRSSAAASEPGASR